MSFTEVKRINGPEAATVSMGIYLGLSSIIILTLEISLGTFVFLFFTINLLISKTIKESTAGLTSLSELETAIREVKTDFNKKNITQSNILELENIREAFIETFTDLEEANNKLAKSGI